MLEADVLQRRAHVFVLHLLSCQRIGGRAPQRAERHVWLLRQHQELRAALHDHLSVAPGPEPCDRAHQRALAGAGLADDQHPLAGRDIHFGLLHHAGAVVEPHRKSVQTQRRVIMLAARDQLDAAGLLGLFERIQRSDERRNAPRIRVPAREARIVVDQPAERGLHDHEGGGRLHDLAERHVAGEIFRRTQEDRDHGREIGACLRDRRRLHPLMHDQPPGFEQTGEMPRDARALLLLAAEQRDAFAVFAQPRQCIAEFGFALILDFGCPHKAPADDQHRARAEQRIEDCGDDEKTRDMNLRACRPDTSSAPPTDHSTNMKVTADRNADRMPVVMSTGASVASRASSPMRYSGLS